MDFAQDRVQQRLVELRAADGGSVEGSAEDGVSSSPAANCQADRRPPGSGVPGANFCEDRSYRSAQDLVPGEN